MQVLTINELKNICHTKFNFNTTGTLLKLNQFQVHLHSKVLLETLTT